MNDVSESPLRRHAEKELRLAGLFDKDSDYGGLVGPAVMKMVDQFADEGHTGNSAGLCIDLFKQVASYKLLTPLGNPMVTREYMCVSDYSGTPPETTLQCTRLGSVFSEDSGSTWYDIDKPIPWWRRKILRQYRAYITFPYMPK